MVREIRHDRRDHSGDWVARIYNLLFDKLGIKKRVITLGGAATELVKREVKACGIDLNEFFGQDNKEATVGAIWCLSIATASAGVSWRL